MPELPDHVLRLIRMAVDEDLGSGDITSEAIFDKDSDGEATIVARQPLVFCGFDILPAVFNEVGQGVSVRRVATEGEEVTGGAVLAELKGPVRVLMSGERTALNFLQRMCGVATLSRVFAEKASGRTVILDSRKTVPGWRWLDKRAVRAGGCQNHRMGLFDGILIKDNHIAASDGIKNAVRRVRAYGVNELKIEVEVENIAELEEAIDSGADIVMLDNFSPRLIREAVKAAGGRVLLEVSGGIHLGNLDPFLEVGGVDFLSVGELTHSAPAADIAMEVRGPAAA